MPKWLRLALFIRSSVDSRRRDEQERAKANDAQGPQKSKANGEAAKGATKVQFAWALHVHVCCNTGQPAADVPWTTGTFVC